ncbi:MAG: glycosyltransferase family 4 protein [bacterium]
MSIPLNSYQGDVGVSGKKLRILIVAPSFDILGGQSVQAARLHARLQTESTLEVGFLPINPRLPGVLRLLQRLTYVRTAVTSLMYVATLLFEVPRYDIVHVFSASYFSFLLAPTPAILIAKLYGKRVLLNYHSGEAEDHLERWRRTAVPTIRMADVVVVPSDYLVRIFAKFGVHAQAVYNLIETDEFRFRKREPLRPVFLSNRNFEKHYGVDQVLRGFAIIQRAVPEARLIVAGGGGERESLEQLAQELNLNASFVGQVSQEQMANLYNQADIFLNCSEIDNQPLSILESFASGLPVVTTAAGGIVDMVTHEKNGLLVDRGDYKHLAATAIQLLEDGEQAESIVTEARRECGNYAWNVLREQWLSLYEKLASARSIVARSRENGIAQTKVAER